MLESVNACVSAFSAVSDKAEVCKTMLQSSEGFADKCTGTIDAFMGTWDLETMGSKITEICRCARLGELIRQFVEQIKNLVMSILSLLKLMMSKLSGSPVAGIREML